MSSLRPQLRKIRRDETGSVAVEFALIVPILIVIISAIVAFGKAYNELEVLTGAAREGARTAAVRATPAEVQAAVVAAAEPYTLSQTPAISQQCNEDTAGSPVTVSWTQTITVEILGLPVLNPTREISGTFRCE